MAEDWQIGAMTIRFASSRFPTVIGVNSLGLDMVPNVQPD